MKIAIPCTEPDLQGTVAHMVGAAAWLLIVETDDMSFEAVPTPLQRSGPGAGIATVSLAVDMGAGVLLVHHIAPHIAGVLQQQSIDVVTGNADTAHKAVADYLEKRSHAAASGPQRPEGDGVPRNGQWKAALGNGLRQFHALLPRLVGVILLLGLFRGFVPEQALLAFFSGSPLRDTLLGGALGGILAGNPVNSYVIGQGLLRSGVGLAGVTALMLAWVGVGVIQLPVEAAALGRRFALVRNMSAFVMAVVMALVVAVCGGGRI